MTANNATSTSLIRVSVRRVDFQSIAVDTSLSIIYFAEAYISGTLRKLTIDPV